MCGSRSQETLQGSGMKQQSEKGLLFLLLLLTVLHNHYLQKIQ